MCTTPEMVPWSPRLQISKYATALNFGEMAGWKKEIAGMIEGNGSGNFKHHIIQSYFVQGGPKISHRFCIRY